MAGKESANEVRYTGEEARAERGMEIQRLVEDERRKTRTQRHQVDIILQRAS